MRPAVGHGCWAARAARRRVGSAMARSWAGATGAVLPCCREQAHGETWRGLGLSGALPLIFQDVSITASAPPALLGHPVSASAKTSGQTCGRDTQLAPLVQPSINSCSSSPKPAALTTGTRQLPAPLRHSCRPPPASLQQQREHGECAVWRRRLRRSRAGGQQANVQPEPPLGAEHQQRR